MWSASFPQRCCLRTEASGRYEKGLDSRNCLPAVERACELVELLGAGTVLDGMVDVDNDQKAPNRIPFQVDWINRFLGIQVSRHHRRGRGPSDPRPKI